MGPDVYYNTSRSTTGSGDETVRYLNRAPEPFQRYNVPAYIPPKVEKKPEPPPVPPTHPKQARLHGTGQDHAQHLRFKRMI